MSFIDDLKMIYQREKNEYERKIMNKLDFFHPNNKFKTFEEWMEFYGYGSESLRS